MLLAHSLTGERWCETWYNRVHAWAFQHFSMPEAGEWWQRLDRRGNALNAVVALPVKYPFHLPRMLILGLELLQHHRP